MQRLKAKSGLSIRWHKSNLQTKLSTGEQKKFERRVSNMSNRLNEQHTPLELLVPNMQYLMARTPKSKPSPHTVLVNTCVYLNDYDCVTEISFGVKTRRYCRPKGTCSLMSADSPALRHGALLYASKTTRRVSIHRFVSGRAVIVRVADAPARRWNRGFVSLVRPPIVEKTNGTKRYPGPKRCRRGAC